MTLVSGFLGAGKTTWLGHRLRHDRDAADLLVVNDFSSTGVDDLTLSDASIAGGPPVESVVGGCLCCEKLDDFTGLLHEAVGRRHRDSAGGREVRHLVVETSGVAEPRRIVDALDADPVLRANLVLRSLVVVLDGVAGHRLLRHRPAVRSQVAVADRVVLTRTDLATAQEVGDLAGVVRRLNATAEIIGAAHGCEHALAEVRPAESEVFDDADEVSDVRSWALDLAPGTNWAEYALWLDATSRAHPDRLLRTKGLVPTADGPLLVQSLGAQVARPTRAPDTTGTSMVFIVDQLDLDVLERSLRTFVPSAFDDPAGVRSA
ncbi:CobW family GTP-binding protein [Pseudonocardia parietis]|uniref:G3E family GTPase n=1 Tax=Pseudonocardia parietis TaxID=570936 RepID=A0ABS4W039_9PSEU|nr:GTP-binding protein [Pseudonocardia parietis]MBP2369575.1 G3E family GTPase [Pseudonocardia parietis]